MYRKDDPFNTCPSLSTIRCSDQIQSLILSPYNGLRQMRRATGANPQGEAGHMTFQLADRRAEHEVTHTVPGMHLRPMGLGSQSGNCVAKANVSRC